MTDTTTLPPSGPGRDAVPGAPPGAESDGARAGPSAAGGAVIAGSAAYIAHREASLARSSRNSPINGGKR